MFAFVLLLRHLVDGSSCEFVTDNLAVHNTYNNGPTRASNSSNCDLWEECFQLISDKSIRVSTRWMPSHIKDGKKVRPESLSDWDIECNDKADQLADQAATLASATIPVPIATNIIYYVSLVSRIQKRLATIIMNLPSRESTPCSKSKESVAKETIGDLVAQSLHSISLSNGNRYSCSVCKSNFKKYDPGLRSWLKGSCVNHNPRDYHKPFRVTDSIHIGNNTTHQSHDIYNYRGVIYCNKCGNFGVKHFNNLSRQCQPPRTAGVRLLKCIDTGQLPVGVSEWPDES